MKLFLYIVAALAMSPFVLVGVVLVRALRGQAREPDVAFIEPCEHGKHEWCDECDDHAYCDDDDAGEDVDVISFEDYNRPAR